MVSLADMPPDALPIPPDAREQLVAPFVEAAQTALREWAQTESAERLAYRQPTCRCHGELVATLELSSATLRRLVLGVSLATADGLARRVMTETLPNPDAALVRDCLGEIANVAGGQAKALLHGTPHAFSFSTPRVALAEVLPSDATEECLVVVLATDVGDVVLQLYQPRS